MRSSKIQYSRIAPYWAFLTLGFSILWSASLNMLGLSGLLPAFSLAGAAIIAAPVAFAIYYTRDRQVLEYDDFGYQLKRGWKEVDKHQWNELKEFSIIKDNYGRLKVRMYAERDGTHYDLDTGACGVNPYLFRAYGSSRSSSQVSEGDSLDLFGALEREIQRGRATWVADLKETFRHYQISGNEFPMFARGSTRPGGFLLSRMAAYMIMPNYNVCLYADSLDSTDAKAKAMRLIRILETQREQHDVKWSWLLLFGAEPPPDSLSRIILDFHKRDIGLGYINSLTGEMITSPNQLGRSMLNQMNMKRLMPDIRRRYKL